jgi:hypothetical protein
MHKSISGRKTVQALCPIDNTYKQVLCYSIRRFQTLKVALLALGFLRILNLSANFLANLLYVLKTFSRPGSGRLVTAFKLFVFSLEQFNFVKQLLEAHDGNSFVV